MNADKRGSEKDNINFSTAVFSDSRFIRVHPRPIPVSV